MYGRREGGIKDSMVELEGIEAFARNAMGSGLFNE